MAHFIRDKLHKHFAGMESYSPGDWSFALLKNSSISNTVSDFTASEPTGNYARWPIDPGDWVFSNSGKTVTYPGPIRFGPASEDWGNIYYLAIMDDDDDVVYYKTVTIPGWDTTNVVAGRRICVVDASLTLVEASSGVAQDMLEHMLGISSWSLADVYFGLLQNGVELSGNGYSRTNATTSLAWYDSGLGGAAPAIGNSGAIWLPTPTANWIFNQWGLFDASTGGRLIAVGYTDGYGVSENICVDPYVYLENLACRWF